MIAILISLVRMRRAKGKNPTQAYIVVGKRLLYHVYSIMRNKKPYRERRPVGGRG